MIIGTTRRSAQAHSTDSPTSVALIPAARSGLDRRHDRTGLSESDLASCAITGSALLNVRLRPGYHLALWKGESGKACTLSLPVGRAAAMHSIRWLPAQGEACGAGSRVPTAPGFHFKAARLFPAQSSRGRRRMVAGRAASLAPPGRAVPLAQQWLLVTDSRGSPAAAPRLGGAPSHLAARHQTVAPEASRDRQKGKPS
jgi:hypothetical protein